MPSPGLGTNPVPSYPLPPLPPETTPDGPSRPGDTGTAPTAQAPIGDDVRYITEDTRGERVFAGVCGQRLKDFTDTMLTGGKSNDPLFSLFDKSNKTDREILRALTTYCASGRFVIGQLNDKKECAETFELKRLHTEVIRRLMVIRPEPADLIAIGCVTTKETLKLWTHKATGILLDHSTIERVEISGAQISYGVIVAGGTKIPGGLSIDASSLGRILEISGGAEIGTPPKDDKDDAAVRTQFDISRSVIPGTILLKNATFHSQLYAPGNRIEGAIEIVNCKFGSAVTLRNNSIHGNLLFEDVTIDGEVSVNSTTLRSLYVTRSTFKKPVNAELLRAEGAVSIHTGKFDSRLVLNRLSAAILSITKSEFGTEKDPDAGSLYLTSAIVRSVTVSYSKFSNQLFAGNARVDAFDLTAVTVPTFDCTDCIIEQYLLLGGAFSREVRLWGAQIKSQLRLRERNICARWSKDAIFDLRGLQTKSIAADYDDLKLTDQPQAERKRPARCASKTVRTLISGANFEHVVPGLRSLNDTVSTSDDPHLVACGFTGTRNSILDHDSDEILCWIENGLGKTDTGAQAYDPRPYQLIAAALETAGRNDAAVDVRIAKVNAENSILKRDFWYWVKLPFKGLSYLISGYGYHNEWAIVWFGVLVTIGFIVYLFGRLPHATEMPFLSRGDYFGLGWYAFWFSVDRAVPPLVLDSTMSEYSILKHWARNYFYLHRAAGTVIITVAIASLTGVFK